MFGWIVTVVVGSSGGGDYESGMELEGLGTIATLKFLRNLSFIVELATNITKLYRFVTLRMKLILYF